MRDCRQKIHGQGSLWERNCLNQVESICRFCRQDFCWKHIGDTTCPEAPRTRWGQHSHITQEIWDAMGEARPGQARTVRIVRQAGTSKPVEVKMTMRVRLPARWHLQMIRDDAGSLIYLGPRAGCEPDDEMRKWLETFMGPQALTREIRWKNLDMAERDLRELLEWEWRRELKQREARLDTAG